MNIDSNSEPRALRTVALVAAVVGAVGSIAFILRVGHRNKSIVLLAMFVLWDVAPFVGLLLAHRASRLWASSARAALYRVTLLVTLASLAIYGVVALGPPRPKPASWFLIVPVASWFLIGVVLRMSRPSSPPRAPASEAHP
ncbi:MAG TPA: hypothetical protein VK124_01510 [Gemmatimonadales bacterium]|nr:hypothetical protein [Gemmatimonadales bacterium]